MTLKEYTEQELTELGFSDFIKSTEIETEDEIHRQIGDDLILSDKVRDEVTTENEGNIVYKDNYEDLLEDWIWEKVITLHGIYDR